MSQTDFKLAVAGNLEATKTIETTGGDVKVPATGKIKIGTITFEIVNGNLQVSKSAT